MELVIVIAVIAILSAVLIPTFVNLTKTAKIAKDTALVRNMNTALAMNEGVNGKNVTMHDALIVIEKNGYSVDIITPTTEGYHYAWDQESDRMVLLNEKFDYYYNEGTPSAKYLLWTIVDNSTELAANNTAGFSTYLSSDFKDKDIVCTKGIDVGNHTDITSITYNNVKIGDVEPTKQDVIIRTNGGNLTINAPLDTLKHYGMSDTVTVTAIAMNSYHEFGYVLMLKVASGRIVVEDTSKTKINSIFIIKVAEGVTNDGVEIQTPDVTEQVIVKEKGLPDTQTIKINEKTPAVRELIEKDELEAKQVAIAEYLNKVLSEDRTKIEAITDLVIQDEIDCWADENNMLAYKVFYYLTQKGYNLSKLNDPLFVESKGGVFIYKGNSEIGTIEYYGNPSEDQKVDPDSQNSFLFVSEEGTSEYFASYSNYPVFNQINAIFVNYPIESEE